MRYRLFPVDLEGVGSYRILYPYAALEAFNGDEAYIEVAEDHRTPGGLIPLQAPAPVGDIPDEFAADVYVFQRRLERWFNLGGGMRTTFGAADIIRWIKQNGRVTVTEIDDLMHYLPRNAPAAKVLERHPELGMDALTDCIRESDILTVSTPALADEYPHPNVHVLPNYLNWPTWQNIPQACDRERGRVRVGWMGWLGWRGGDLEVLRGLIGPWLEKHPEAEFVSVGNTDVLDYLQIPEGQRRHVQGKVFPGHAEPTAEIDIGLVPLELTRFNECKSALKGMEYAACGIPCIATPTGPYREWVEPGVNGLLARKPRQWLAALDEMLAGDLWREMGRAARAKAEQHTIQQPENWQRWARVYESPHDRHLGPAASRASAAA